MALAAVFAAALSVAAFASASYNQFVYDDFPIVAKNPLVTESGPWYRFWIKPYWPKGLSSDKLYRPLTIWSYRANVVLSGKDSPEPEAFRAVNIGLHALTSAGVALLAWRVTRRQWSVWLAGALFAVHPIHTEAVVTAYGRSELLAGLFAVYLLARYVGQGRGEKDTGTRRHGDTGTEGARGGGGEGGKWRRVWFHLSNALLFLLAIMSKEHALFVWPVLVLYDIWRYRQMDPSRRPSLRRWINDVAAPAHVGFILAMSAFFVLRFNVFSWRYRLGADELKPWAAPLAHANLVEHLLTPFRFLWLTLKLLVWPRELCPIWSIPALSLPRRLDPDVIAGMILLLVLVALSVILWRRRSASSPLLVGLLVLLAIPLQALPMANWLFAERWLYLPSVLIAVLIGAGLARLRPLGGAVGLAAAIVLLPASWQYASKFADNMTMMSEVVQRQPSSFQGRRYQAALFYQQGQYRAATLAAQEMIERFPQFPDEAIADAYDILLKSHLALGEGRKALEALEKCEWLRRDNPLASYYDERKEAEALIARERAQSRPATSTAAPA